MVTTRQITGSKEQIVAEIASLNGRILSATVVVDEAAIAPFIAPSDAEFAAMMAELVSLAVSAPNVDYSREAMYTRMPGE